MGKVNFGGFEHIEAHTHTETEYYNSVSEEVLNSRLRHIVDAITSNPNLVCYVVGMGAQPRATYKSLDSVDGIRVMWTGSILPKYARVLGFVIASHAGLVKIENPDSLSKVMNALTEQSMAGVYVFSPDIEKHFVERVTAEPAIQGIVFGVKSDPAYFFYVVDADNFESRTGIVEIVSYGKRATPFKQFF